MPSMTDDAHAQANAEQVRLLREALAVMPGTAEECLAGEAVPALTATQLPEVGSPPEAPHSWHPVSQSSTRP